LPEGVSLKKQWPDIKAIDMAINITRDKDGNERGDVRFFIVSRYMSGKRFTQAVCGHWGRREYCSMACVTEHLSRLNQKLEPTPEEIAAR
jgi:hypothetical protein